MPIKYYVIHCEICGNRTVTRDKDLPIFPQIARAPVPAGIPKLNEETGKVQTVPSIPQPLMFKCPTCGRGVRRVRYHVDRSEHEEEKQEEKHLEKEDHSDGREAGSAGPTFSG